MTQIFHLLRCRAQQKNSASRQIWRICSRGVRMQRGAVRSSLQQCRSQLVHCSGRSRACNRGLLRSSAYGNRQVFYFVCDHIHIFLFIAAKRGRVGRFQKCCPLFCVHDFLLLKKCPILCIHVSPFVMVVSLVCSCF